MATRFYLPDTGAAAVNPAFGAWTSSAGMDRIAAVRTKINSTLVSRVCAENAGANANVGARQYVSEPLSGAGTTSGTVKGIIRCLTAIAANDAEAQCLIRICSNDGSTFRTPVVIDFDNAALSNEFATALTNRGFPRGLDAETVGTVNWSDGDRIVIEVGALMHVGGEGSSSLNLGDPTGSDCAEDETGTDAFAPWIEFSQDLFAASTYEQRAFRHRNDDGSETTATWKAALNTNPASLATGVNHRLRIEAQNDGTDSAAGPAFKWQYNKNSGGWNDITATSAVIQTAASANFADGDDTTQQLGGGGTFETDNNAMEESTGTFTLTGVWEATNIFETELCYQIVAANVYPADSIQIRIVESGGTAFTTYTQTPTITVAGPVIAWVRG